MWTYVCVYVWGQPQNWVYHHRTHGILCKAKANDYRLDASKKKWNVFIFLILLNDYFIENFNFFVNKNGKISVPSFPYLSDENFPVVLLVPFRDFPN